MPRYSIEEQEERILNAAAECISESTLLDFTMSAVSQKAELSMGSIYKHIKTKEDVLVALATRMFEHLYEAFDEIFSFPLTTPERLMALLMLSPMKLNCFSFGVHLDMMIGNEVILDRASPDWRAKMLKADKAIENLFSTKMSEACHNGELDVTEDNRERLLEEILVGMWSLDVGYTQVVLQRYSRTDATDFSYLPLPLEPDAPLVSCAKRMLNSYPWRDPITDQ